MALSKVKVRKARFPSLLSCGCYVLTGHRIVSRGNGWVCIECDQQSRATGTTGEASDG